MLLLLLPAAPHAWEVFQRRENWASFVVLPTLEQLSSDRFARRAAPLAWYFAPALVCVFLSHLDRRRRAFHNQAPEFQAPLFLLIVWIAAPVAAAWLLSVTDVTRIFLYRYLIASAAAAPLVAGLLCAACPTRLWRAIAAAGTVAAAVGCVAPDYLHQLARDRRLIADRDENWRSAVAHLRGQDDQLSVLLYAGLIETKDYAASPDPVLRAYCIFPLNAIYWIDGDRPVLPLTSLAALPAETCRTIDEQGGAWMLLRVPAPNVPAAVVRCERLVQSCVTRARVIESKSFGGVTVVRIERER
jgi:hypothetical protein